MPLNWLLLQLRDCQTHAHDLIYLWKPLMVYPLALLAQIYFFPRIRQSVVLGELWPCTLCATIHHYLPPDTLVTAAGLFHESSCLSGRNKRNHRQLIPWCVGPTMAGRSSMRRRPSSSLLSTSFWIISDSYQPVLTTSKKLPPPNYSKSSVIPGSFIGFLRF